VAHGLLLKDKGVNLGEKRSEICRRMTFMSFGGGFGGGNFYGPQGPYGAYPGCGCSGLLIFLAGILLVFGGCLRMVGQ
jgi:hypothetical protein